jgi:serine/threonine protein kinase
MPSLIQSVAESLVDRLKEEVRETWDFVGFTFLDDLGNEVWAKYAGTGKIDELNDEVERLANAGDKEIQDEAAAVARRVAANVPDALPVVELYLTQIPGWIRQSLKRESPPDGQAASSRPALTSPDDLARLLPPALPQFRPGDALPGKPGWVLVRLLGLGGFGEVKTSDRDVLHEAKVIDRLCKEGSRANIVRMIDACLDCKSPWLMYEYVDGGDLSDRIRAWGGLPIADRQAKTVAALAELARAIGDFHRLAPAIVHRDLKPANILCRKDGRLLIADFGISGIAAEQWIESEKRGTTTRAGRLQSYLHGSYTPLYASPQQRDGAAPDPRDDVHALGVIGYQMLTGQLSHGVGPDFAEDLSEAGVDGELIDLLRRCTAQKVERRPKDAGDVADCLARLPQPRANAAAEHVHAKVVHESRWGDAVREIVADPIQKLAFIHQARALQETLRVTQKNIESTRVLSIIFPAVFGSGLAIAAAVSLSVGRVFPIWIAISIGLGFGALISGLLLVLLWVIRRGQQAKQDAALEMFAAAHPTLAERCGGAERLRNRDLIRAILLAVDDQPKPGFFRRLFGG